MVFAAVRTHFPKKNTRVNDDPAAINKQLFKYHSISCAVVSTVPFHSRGLAVRQFDLQWEQIFFFWFLFFFSYLGCYFKK